MYNLDCISYTRVSCVYNINYNIICVILSFDYLYEKKCHRDDVPKKCKWKRLPKTIFPGDDNTSRPCDWNFELLGGGGGLMVETYRFCKIKRLGVFIILVRLFTTNPNGSYIMLYYTYAVHVVRRNSYIHLIILWNTVGSRI